MVLPATARLLYGGVALGVGVARFWRDASGGAALNWRAIARATREALALEHLKGGGAGCTYPDARFSHARRLWHQLVLAGFALDLASTALAALYEHALGRLSPFPLWSAPVVLGSAGGLAICIGCAGLLWLKRRSDRAPAAAAVLGLDVAFLALLGLTSATGLLLLALRETPAMGLLLAVHLGAVAGFFLTLPYGKLAHVGYRYAALLRHAAEQQREGEHERA
jgi:citrate/tricarballylate utilization protein